ncbi:hypothetical protein GCK32_017217 [Trichostrongylus colubriformis]|uniref:Uncharacterized protein n=1 Tax=Trichostrongylus colubriformis TaxID=6319 RepID=A0AAN8J206_TRICO
MDEKNGAKRNQQMDADLEAEKRRSIEKSKEYQSSGGDAQQSHSDSGSLKQKTGKGKKEKSFWDTFMESAHSIFEEVKKQYKKINHAALQWWTKFTAPFNVSRSFCDADTEGSFESAAFFLHFPYTY